MSALDVSIQAQIVNLLDDLQDDLGLTYLFVAHDLSVVRHISDSIAVMYLGKLMEVAPAEELYAKPIHPYTQALLGGDPDPRPRAEPPARAHPARGRAAERRSTRPTGCRFHTRCPHATDICRTIEPPLTDTPTGISRPATIRRTSRARRSPAPPGRR